MQELFNRFKNVLSQKSPTAMASALKWWETQAPSRILENAGEVLRKQVPQRSSTADLQAAADSDSHGVVDLDTTQNPREVAAKRMVSAVLNKAVSTERQRFLGPDLQRFAREFVDKEFWAFFWGNGGAKLKSELRTELQNLRQELKKSLKGRLDRERAAAVKMAGKKEKTRKATSKEPSFYGGSDVCCGEAPIQKAYHVTGLRVQIPVDMRHCKFKEAPKIFSTLLVKGSFDITGLNSHTHVNKDGFQVDAIGFNHKTFPWAIGFKHKPFPWGQAKLSWCGLGRREQTSIKSTTMCCRATALKRVCYTRWQTCRLRAQLDTRSCGFSAGSKPKFFTQLVGPQMEYVSKASGQFTIIPGTWPTVYLDLAMSYRNRFWGRNLPKSWRINWCAFAETDKGPPRIRISGFSDQGTACCGTDAPQFSKNHIRQSLQGIRDKCGMDRREPGYMFSSLMAKRGPNVGAFNFAYSEPDDAAHVTQLFNPWKKGRFARVGAVEARKDGFAFQWCSIGVKKKAQPRFEEIDEREAQSSMARSRWEQMVSAIQMEGASCLTCKFPSCQATVGDRFSTYRPEKGRRSGRG